MTDVTQPIQVNDSPLPDQLWAGVRQVAPPLLTFAIGRHWIPDDLAALLPALGVVIWALVAGQLKTRERAKDLATVVRDPRVPDELAVIK